MRNLLRIQTAVLVALCSVAALPAQDVQLASHNNAVHNNAVHNNAGGHGLHAHAGPCGTCCPSCHQYCQLTVTPDVEEKNCWEIECEEICIPAVRFPWEKCCEPKCGTVITVKRLKKVTYECPTCKYEWTPVCSSCGNCCGAPGQYGPGQPGQLAPPPGAPLPPAPVPGDGGPPVPPPVNGAANSVGQRIPLARPINYQQR